MSEHIELRELQLTDTEGNEVVLNYTSAAVNVTGGGSGHREWFIEVHTNHTFDPNVSSYRADMVASNGQPFNGTVLTPYGSSASVPYGTVVLEGTGALNGYELTR